MVSVRQVLASPVNALGEKYDPSRDYFVVKKSRLDEKLEQGWKLELELESADPDPPMVLVSRARPKPPEPEPEPAPEPRVTPFRRTRSKKATGRKQ